MSDPTNEQRGNEDLELDAEEVTDLDVKDQQGEQVRGGTYPDRCALSGGSR